MTLYRRKGSKIWQYDFYKRGKRHVGSTGCTNKNDARDVESTLKADAAKAKFGLAPAKQSPPLAEFLEGKFLLHVDQHSKTRSTAKAYASRVKRLLQWKDWRDLPLSAITGDVINQFIAHRTGLTIDGINSELSTLRKAMYLAAEWDLCKRIKVRLLPGAKGRDFIVSPQLEAEYLEAATYPLKQVAVLMIDLGFRPEECICLRKSDIDETVHVRHGKTANAYRVLPMTERARQVTDLLRALFPSSEWLFPGYKGRHMTPKYITHRHEELRDAHGWPDKFVLYSFRHTAATRLGDAGANPFELMAFLGHSDIRMVARYVHSSSENLRLALKRREALDKMLRGEATHDASSPSFQLDGQPKSQQ